MKHSKVLLGTCLLLAIAIALVACSDSAETPGQQTTDDTSNRATTSSAAAPETATSFSTTTATTTSPPTTTTTTRPPTTTTTTQAAGDVLRLLGFAGFMADSTWDGVVIIENTSSSTIVIDTGEIVLRTASDAIIDTQWFSTLIVYPGVNYLNAQLYEPAAIPEKIDVNYDEAEFADAGRFTVSNLQVSEDEWTVDISGEVTSTFAQDQDFVTLTAVFFASDGTPLFSETTYIDRVESGGTALFNESLWIDEAAPAWDYVEVYAHP